MRGGKKRKKEHLEPWSGGAVVGFDGCWWVSGGLTVEVLVGEGEEGGVGVEENCCEKGGGRLKAMKLLSQLCWS